MSFAESLDARIQAVDSLVCVGLDPDWERLPAGPRQVATAAERADAVIRFNAAIIEATATYVAAYKPNLAFYLPLGAEGIRALLATRELVPAGIPVILDAKVNDMGNTAERYARAYFDEWGFDAVTLTPYLGTDSIEPFTRRRDRGVLLVTRTSNPSGAEIQELPVGDASGESLAEHIAQRAMAWDTRWPGAVGLVVGATVPAPLRRIRVLAPTLPILLPGVGAQVGDVAASVEAGCDANGRGLLVSASRSIIYAGSGEDYAVAAGNAARALRDEVNATRSVPTSR